MNTVAVPVIPESKEENLTPNRQIHVITINDPIMENLENPIKSIIYSRAKTVKYLSMIDSFFLFINLIVSIILGNLFWLFFLFTPLCYCGYKGSKEYKKDYLTGYITYLLFMTLIYLTYCFYYNNFFILIIFMIECYFLFYTIRLYQYLSRCPQELLTSLQDGWKPSNVEYFYY